MCDRVRSATRRVELREEEAIARIDQAEALQARYLRGLAVQKTFRETARRHQELLEQQINALCDSRTGEIRDPVLARLLTEIRDNVGAVSEAAAEVETCLDADPAALGRTSGLKTEAAEAQYKACGSDPHPWLVGDRHACFSLPKVKRIRQPVTFKGRQQIRPVPRCLLQALHQSLFAIAIYWPFPPRVPGIPDSFASHPAVRAFHQDAWWVFAVLSAVHLVLYFRRRADRRREGMTGERPAVGALSISQARLLPVAGSLMWVMVAAILAPA